MFGHQMQRVCSVRLKGVRRSDLPPLAWAAIYDSGRRVGVLVHGDHVNVRQDTFVEGVWSGDFSRMAFESATTFSGSGGRVAEDELTVSASTHTLQPLYVVRLPRAIVVSNSMVFALQATGNSLDARYRYHDVDIMSVVLGIRDAVRSLPTSQGAQLEIFYHCNLRIKHSLCVDVEPKPLPPRFEKFEDYASFLQSEVSAVVANATAAERPVRFTPLATLSSGYDSPACAVLAKRAGCSEALTFSTPAAAYAHATDSGTEVGRFIEFTTHEVDPSWYMSQACLAEAEFIAPGYGGDDVIYAGAEPLIRGRLLIAGYHGDRVWSRFGTDSGREIERGDPSGGSLLEFRLRTSFHVLPVPFIGCTRLEDIRRISNSSAMRPWSVPWTTYDRPIPRRMVEEAGVPREVFGIKKRAAARPIRAADIDDPPLKSALSPVTLADFERWSAVVPMFTGWWDRARFSALHGAQELIRHGVLRLAKTLRATRHTKLLHWHRGRRTGIPWRYAKPRNRQSLLLLWSHERLQGRYPRVVNEMDGDARVPRLDETY